MRRSKSVWLRGSIRIRCAECGWLMIRPPAVFLGQRMGPYNRSRGGEMDEAIINCPKCEIATYAVVPPEKNTIPWPPTEGDENWYEKGLEMINERQGS